MAETQIQILSDLHLETPPSYDIFNITPHARHLALLGDIGYVKEPGFFLFLRRQLSAFHTVLFLLGNHEPYHSNWPSTRAKMKEFETEMAQQYQDGKILGKFVLLDQTRCDISPSVSILGCTLYSHVPPEQTESVSFGVQDFYNIEDWSIDDHRAAHSADLAWLNTRVESISRLEPDRKIVIFTHHSPCIDERTIDPRHAGSNRSSGFMSDLSKEACWTSKNVKIWAYGHTHFNCDFEDSATGKRVVANQRGYYFSQSSGFGEGKIIQL
ncbi:hypothetical protein AJ79_10184 [Helicocarpus griseus UAMH5409]|uniref:Calcineurin-like phosphoesterase domain-containing protein n=1 Tax=Helicocarpus griseus UAMH5409 TaxID=1447875 RepID=A0A2B7WF66_9EURO|nr:hypothetical protein AJ79_10184 [Helicocarpus griseus UAMH5409]